MAVGGLAVDGGNIDGLGDRITLSVVIACVVAATSGLIFGYDLGISGASSASPNSLSSLCRFFCENGVMLRRPPSTRELSRLLRAMNA